MEENSNFILDKPLDNIAWLILNLPCFKLLIFKFQIKEIH